MKLSPQTLSEIIEMAWCDKTSFEDIKTLTGLSEKDVIHILRAHLKPRSFKVWRTRVTGRSAKHKVRNKSITARQTTRNTSIERIFNQDVKANSS